MPASTRPGGRWYAGRICGLRLVEAEPFAGDGHVLEVIEEMRCGRAGGALKFVFGVSSNFRVGRVAGGGALLRDGSRFNSFKRVGCNLSGRLLRLTLGGMFF